MLKLANVHYTHDTVIKKATHEKMFVAFVDFLQTAKVFPTNFLSAM